MNCKQYELENHRAEIPRARRIALDNYTYLSS
jgi:hypothetical protein